MEKRLEEICTPFKSDILVNKIADNNGNYPLWGAKGLIKNIDYYIQDRPYISIIKWGAGVGRADVRPAYTSMVATMQGVLPNDEIDIDWLCYLLRSMHLEQHATAAVIPNLYFKDYCKRLVSVPNFSEQIEIKTVFKRIESILERRLDELEMLDQLIKARFVELFGDPVMNEKGWPTKPLLDMGQCKNGMNFHYDDEGVEINCLGVGDFKDFSSIDKTDELPTVSLNEMPSEEYLLKDDDIVFVRSNGNKALVGRSLAVYPGDVPTTFSGFCIRYRKHDNQIIVPYLLRVLKADSMRMKMVGRGANIQNLNQQILGTLIIPVPPIELQKQFADFVKQVDKSKVVVQKALDETKLLFDSLMQKYFG